MSEQQLKGKYRFDTRVYMAMETEFDDVNGKSIYEAMEIFSKKQHQAEDSRQKETFCRAKIWMESAIRCNGKLEDMHISEGQLFITLSFDNPKDVDTFRNLIASY